MALVLSGCGQKVPDLLDPPERKCYYPKLPTYKTPASRSITPPKDLGNGECVVKVADLLELSSNNKKLRAICWKYAKVAVKVNSEYQKDEE